MGSYVTLTMRVGMYQEIIDALMTYCSKLDDYWSMEEAVHLIDALEEEYNENMAKQNKEYQQWQEYEKLFHERFKDGEFKDEEGNINKKGMFNYKYFNRVNKILQNYKEGGVLDILDEKQQFFLVLDLIDIFEN